MTKQFHFLGVGGIGMSALAHLLIERGDRVSGSDLKALSHLSEKGIEVEVKGCRRAATWLLVHVTGRKVAQSKALGQEMFLETKIIEKY